MKGFRGLRILDPLRPMFEWAGIDYPIMMKILQVKLVMDGRRVPMVLNGSQRKDKDGNNFIKSLGIYVLFGLITLPFLWIGDNFAFQMSIIFGMIMFLVSTSLISDFSSVMLDVKDKTIFSTKPINERTIGAAKIIHIFIYLLLLTLSIASSPLIGVLIKNGILFFALFLVELLFMNFIIIVLTTMIYMIILKFFDGEKLKDIINYVQIALSITMAVGYQLISRVFNTVDLTIVFIPSWWQYFIIPVWFGAPFEWAFHHDQNAHYKFLSLCAFVVPIIALFLYIKLMPSFERNLQKLSNHSVSNKKKRLLPFYLSRFICANRIEKTFYRFTISMLKNERSFKLKVYPALGFSVVFPFIVLFNQIQQEGFGSIGAGSGYYSLYLNAIFIPTVVMMVKFTDSYKGAWVYQIMPDRDEGSVIKGVLKAVTTKLFLPVFFLENVIFLFLFGVRIVPDIVIVFLTELLFIVICYQILDKAFPFSRPMEEAHKGESFKILGSIIVLAALAGIHFLISHIPWGLYVYVIILFGANFIVWRKKSLFSI